MADVAELGVKLEAHGDAQVVAAMNRVERAVQGTHQSTLQMGAAIGAASAAATAAFGVIANAAQAAFGGVGESVVGMNSRLEQSSIAFTTMLGSAERAGAFLKDLQQFAAQTPFEFPELQDASKRMLAFGFQSQQVIPLLTAVGNAAAAMGSGKEGIDRITTALGQMQAKGKASAEEMMQLTEAGMPAWDMLAKKLGTDVAGAMAAVSRGAVDANTVITAFTEGSAARFGGMMEAQAHTFAGAMSTIKDVVGQLVGGAFRSFFDVLSGLADRLAQFAQSETVSVWAQDLQIKLGALTPLFSDLGAWLEAQLPAAMSAAEAAVGGFVAAVQDLGPRLQDLAQTVGPQLAEGWDRLTTVLGNVGGAFAAITGPLGTVFGAVQQLELALNDQLGAALNGLGDQLGRAAEAMAPLVTALWNMGEAGRGAELDALAAVAAVVGEALSALGTAASTAFQSLQIGMVDAANVVIPQLEALRDQFVANILPILANVQEGWEGFWSHAGPLVSAAWGVIQPILAAIGSVLATVVVVELQAMKAVWDRVWGGITDAIAAIAPVIQAAAAQVGGGLAAVSDALTAWLESLKTPTAQAAEEVGTGIKNNIVAGVAPVAQEVEQATAPAAAAIIKVGTSASAAAPAVASLGTAGTTAAAGLSTASKEAQTLDQVMSQLAKATTPEAVQQALLWQNANSALAEVMKSLDLETAAQVTAMKNAGDVYAAVTRAFESQGLTANDAAAAIHGLASAHDQLAAAAGRSAAAVTASTGAAASANGGAMGAPPNNAGPRGVPSVVAGWDALADRILGGTMHVQVTSYASEAQGQMAAVFAQLERNASTNTYANGGASIGVNGPNLYTDPLIGPYLQRHPEALTNVANRLGGPDVAHGLASPDYSAYNAELQRLAEQENEVIGAEQIRTKATHEDTRATQAHTGAVVRATQDADFNFDNLVDAMGPLPGYFNEMGQRVFQSAAEMGNFNIRWRDLEQAALRQHDVLGRLNDDMQLAARTASAGGDMVGAAAARAALQVSDFAANTHTTAEEVQKLAQAASAAAAAQWRVAQAVGAALQAGQMRNAGVAGGVTERGLTYTQIMGGQTPGSSTGISTLGTGSYYGLPVVSGSPITEGSLRGYADGGPVPEPSWIVSQRTGRAYAQAGEAGPEWVGPGGGTTIQVTIHASGVDALRDAAFWDQAVSRQIRPALRRVGVAV